MSELRIDVWSDIACPWCYVGKRHLEAALDTFDADVEVIWRAFELDPSAPAEHDSERSYAERLATKYGTEVARAEQMIAHMTATAADRGIDMRFDRIRPGNTFDAHRLLHLALDEGGPALQGALKERLLAAYFSEGRAIGDRTVLAELAAHVELPSARVAEVLEGSEYTGAVRDEQAAAAALGIRGVPCFVVGQRYAVSGAQPPEALRQLLERARSEEQLDVADGSACDATGCS